MTALERAIQESKEREEKATTGPWYTLGKPWTDDDGIDRVVQTTHDPHMGEPICDVQMIMEWDEQVEEDPFAKDRANGRFIAASRTWEPAFREMVEACKKALHYYRGVYPEPNGKEVYTRRAIETLAELERLAKEGLGEK